MTVSDATSMDRTAQDLVVELRYYRGSPPAYGSAWTPIWTVAVDRIEINMGADSSWARFSFLDQRWDARFRRLGQGTMVRIRTLDSPYPAVVFQGFVTGFSSSFTGGSGGGEQFTRADETNAVICRDYRWCLGVTSVVSGQHARGPDDYTDYGTFYEAPLWNRYQWLSGRRVIFNPEGRPNMDPTLLHLTDGNYSIPIFAPPDSAGVEYWTARDMVGYLLSPLVNETLDYMPIFSAAALLGINDSDWDTVLSNIVVEGLNVVEALDLICRHLGWSFREDYAYDDDPTLTFFKPGNAESYYRSTSFPTMLHSLHAPAAGESILPAVAEGRKMLWSMAMQEDYASVVNTPWGNGAPDRFEFTAALVPAWNDSDLDPDTSGELANLYFTDAQLQDLTAPNGKSYYRWHHVRGSGFRRNVGRQWSLNETGKYSLAPLSRGGPFDLATVIPSEYILDSAGRRCFARFARQLLPCLSMDAESENSVGVKVEFSLDGGSTWQVLPCSIRSLPDECGIYITEPNLCEMVDQSESLISDGPLDGVQLNYFTSLADDILNSRSWPAWRTLCRVTASIQTDRRIARYAEKTSSFTSPFHHRRLYDFSAKYGLAARTSSSVFNGSLTADEYNYSDALNSQLDAIRDAAQDGSLSGIFVLDRLWLGDGSGEPDFQIGDGIEQITGRDISLSGKVGSRNVYPEVVRIVYQSAEQRMQLITRDLRFAEVTL